MNFLLFRLIIILFDLIRLILPLGDCPTSDESYTTFPNSFLDLEKVNNVDDESLLAQTNHFPIQCTYKRPRTKKLIHLVDHIASDPLIVWSLGIYGWLIPPLYTQTHGVPSMKIVRPFSTSRSNSCPFTSDTTPLNIGNAVKLTIFTSDRRLKSETNHFIYAQQYVRYEHNDVVYRSHLFVNNIRGVIESGLNSYFFQEINSSFSQFLPRIGCWLLTNDQMNDLMFYNNESDLSRQQYTTSVYFDPILIQKESLVIGGTMCVMSLIIGSLLCFREYWRGEPMPPKTIKNVKDHEKLHSISFIADDTSDMESQPNFLHLPPIKIYPEMRIIHWKDLGEMIQTYKKHFHLLYRETKQPIVQPVNTKIEIKRKL
ncbi:hypothetical protein SNEBB_004218 [Seison nebaliae]|nr:hypothetical protein SNEBB_004218 [Seison nebaliae]